jgi:hypothetical protein
VNALQKYFRFDDLGSGEDSGIASRSTQDTYFMCEPSSTNPVSDAPSDESGIARSVVNALHYGLFKGVCAFCTFLDCKEAESELDVAQRFSQTYFSLDVDVHADK